MCKTGESELESFSGLIVIILIIIILAARIEAPIALRWADTYRVHLEVLDLYGAQREAAGADPAPVTWVLRLLYQDTGMDQGSNTYLLPSKTQAAQVTVQL